MARKKKVPKRRSVIAEQMILRTGNHAGPHLNRKHTLRKGATRKQKHKGQLRELAFEVLEVTY